MSNVGGFLRGLATWRNVRNLGKLRILTRASYLSIVFVPVVSATWPFIQAAVCQYNNVMCETAEVFNEASERLDKRLADLPHDSRVAELVRDFRKRVERWHSDFAGRTIERPFLPSTLAIAFYASLLVVFGHFAYETRCPALIKETTEEEFAAELLRGFRENIEHRKDRLRRAQEHLRKFALYLPVARKSDSLVELTHRRKWVEIPTDKVESFWAKQDGTIGDPNNDIGNIELMQLAIEQGARAEYRAADRRNRLSAVVATLLYYAAIMLVMWILISQCRSIWISAGFPGSW
jgi:hypothetical protein